MFILNKIYILLILIISLNCTEEKANEFKIKKGKLDLTNWNTEDIINLDGEWEFYPYQLIQPNTSPDESKKKFIEVPGVWNQEIKHGQGFGTYRLQIKLPSLDKPNLLLKLQEMGTAYALFANGKQIAKNGIVGTIKSKSIPQHMPIISDYLPQEQDIELLLHISNFHNRDGGLWYTILIGNESKLRELREKKMLHTLFLCGILVTMFIYHVVIYIIRRKEKSTLVFSLFCLAVSIHLLGFNEKYLNQIFQDNSFLFLNRLEYLSYYLAVPIFSHFLNSIFPEEFSNKIKNINWLFCFLFSSIVLLFDSDVYTYTILAYHPFTSFNMIYFLYVIYKASKNNREGSLIILIGTIFFFVGVTNDMLHSLTLIHTTFLIPQSFFIFIFAHSIGLSLRFSNALTKVENLSESLHKMNLELEKKVLERTKKLQEEKEKAIEANAIKDKFVSIVSHDLRTPLIGVNNLLEILQSKKIKVSNLEKSEYLKMSQESIQYSLSMIKELLNLNKLETGILKIEKNHIPAKSLFDLAIHELKPQLNSKKIEIVSQIKNENSIFVDKGLFLQVVRNLLINSIKFSYELGKIQISIKYNQNSCKIIIRDYGIGMSDEEMKSILSNTIKISKNGTAGETGTGLGLYICKYILDAHGGNIQFKSQKGKGTSCILTLPV